MPFNQIMKERWRKRGRERTKAGVRAQGRERERDWSQSDINAEMTHQSERGLECGVRPAAPINPGGVDAHTNQRTQRKKPRQDNP